MTIITPAHADVTVRYADGSIKITSNPSYPTLNDALFASLAAATAKTGKATLLSYRNVAAVVALDAADKTEINIQHWVAINDRINQADVNASR